MDTTLARSPIGRLLNGRYRVESHIARGGMADVYLGTDTRLERLVALKIMRAELANDEDFVRRFIGEARSVARLSHQNVVAVFDQGADGRTLYLAMEYVRGRSLRALLRGQGRLAPRAALDVMEGVLAGLAAAHQAGLAHRDVKPENVLLAEVSNAVKVVDFGLARLVSEVSHTKTGMIIGTAAYLAPEQVARGVTDARSDVYAAGVMLFELLTGRQPHTGETPLAVAHKHVDEVVPAPSSLVPGLPPALDMLVAMATSRDPELRPADAGQFLAAITGVRRSLPPEPGPAVAGSPLAAAAPALPGAGARAPAWEAPAGGGAGTELSPRPGPTGGATDLIPGMGTDGGPGADLIPGMGTDRGPGADLIPGIGTDRGPGADLIPGMGTAGGATDLIPGVAPPARQSYGVPAGTSQLHYEPGPGDFYQPANHTLVVRADDADDRSYARPGRLAERAAGVQGLLFSRRLLYLIGGLLVVAAVALLSWWQLAGRYTTVPQVNGLPVAMARSDLQAVGLTVHVSPRKRIDNSVPKGDVVSTSPGGGLRITRGGSVLLIVSAGPREASMPQVTGQPLDAARAALRKAGLTPGAVKMETSATIPAGIVISTVPAAGTMWPQPRPVRMTVSAGPPLPNFVGQQKGAAEAWAQANGVALNEVPVQSDQPPGTITRQSPAAGVAFTRGEVVTIGVSNGPPSVTIPNLDGMRADQAAKLLHRLGFQVAVTRVGPLQTVFNYSPSGQAPQGSTVTLMVGLPSLG